MPQIQLSKGFGETVEAKATANALDQKFKTFLADSLAESLKAKRDELSFLRGALEPQNILNELGPRVSARTAELCAKQIPEFTSNEQGELTISGWTTNPAAVDLGRQVLEDCVVYAMRVISITDAIEFAEQNKRKSKKNIQEAADIEMADLSGGNSTKMQSIIDKAVARALKGKDKETKKVSTVAFRDVLAFSFDEASSSQSVDCKLTLSSEAEQEEGVLFLETGESSHGEKIYSTTHGW